MIYGMVHRGQRSKKGYFQLSLPFWCVIFGILPTKNGLEPVYNIAVSMIFLIVPLQNKLKIFLG